MGFITPLLHRLCIFGILFAIILILCRGESDSLDIVPTSQIDLQAVEAYSSNNDTWLQGWNPTKSKNLCNQSTLWLYPKVKTFVVKGGICLTNVSQDKSHLLRSTGSRARVVDEPKNFTDCIVSSISPCSNTSNSTCHRPSLLHIKGEQLVFAALDCTRSSERQDYCLVLFPSRKFGNWESQCSKRILPKILATPTPTTPSSTPIKISEDALKSKISGLIEDNLFMSIGILFLLVVVIVGVLCCCCCCRRKKNSSSEAGLEPLPPLTSARGHSGSQDSVLYIEPNAPTDPRFRVKPEKEVTHSYDYAYAHQVRGGHGNNPDRRYVNVRIPMKSDDSVECFPEKDNAGDGKKCSSHKRSGPKADRRYVNMEYEMKSECDDECSWNNDSEESRKRYSSLRRSAIEDDNEYQPLSCPTHSAKEKKVPLHYVKVL